MVCVFGVKACLTVDCIHTIARRIYLNDYVVQGRVQMLIVQLTEYCKNPHVMYSRNMINDHIINERTAKPCTRNKIGHFVRGHHVVLYIHISNLFRSHYNCFYLLCAVSVYQLNCEL